MQNDIRRVGNKEIYDSYMGILRISPNDSYNDDITNSLKNLNNEVVLSDSDGNELGGNFRFRTRLKKMQTFDSNISNLVFIESVCTNIKSLKSFNARNFFTLKKRYR